MKNVTVVLHEEDAMEASKALSIKALDWRNSSAIWDSEHKLKMRKTADTLERVAGILKEACYRRRREATNRVRR